MKTSNISFNKLTENARFRIGIIIHKYYGKISIDYIYINDNRVNNR